MRNRRIAAKIQAALERSQTPQNGEPNQIENALPKLDKVRYIVDRRLEGERNWKVEEIVERENIGYMTVHRALKGRPGWLPYGRTIRVTDTLYRSWLTAIAIGMSLDDFFSLPMAS
jgi:hypothetical protein